MAFRPRPFTCCTASSSFAWSDSGYGTVSMSRQISKRETSAPSPASANADARPFPRAPPVTIATLPSSFTPAPFVCSPAPGLVLVRVGVLVLAIVAVLVPVFVRRDPLVRGGLVWTWPLHPSRHRLPQNHSEQVRPLRGVGSACAVPHPLYAQCR